MSVLFLRRSRVYLNPNIGFECQSVIAHSTFFVPVTYFLSYPLSKQRMYRQKQESTSNTSMFIGGSPRTYITERLKLATKDRKIERLIIRRRNIDASMNGYIQDLLASRDSWKLIELNTSSIAVARIIKNALLYVRHVDRLVIIEPNPSLVSLLTTTVLGKNTNDHYAKVQAVSIISGSFSIHQASALNQGLSHNPSCSLTNLRLTKCTFSNSKLCSSSTVLREAGIGLRNCMSLKQLSLCQCHLEDEEVAIIVTQLRDHATLESLDLSVNYCQLEGTKAIAKMLGSSKALKCLDLSCQDVWDDRSYFVHICEALKNPDCRLEALDIASNFLNDQHLGMLMDCLEVNTTVQKVVLSDNSISDIGMACLSSSLPSLSLKCLDITNNAYTSVQILESGMARNTSFCSLQLDNHSPQLVYFLALNQNGRYLKVPNSLPISMWPVVLERTAHCLKGEQKSAGITPADIIFDLLHGPALLDL